MTSAQTPPVAAAAAAAAAWRNRIVGHAEADPRDLKANEKNWRRHPATQADALAGVLSEVGLVQSVIVNRTTGRLVDGHLRVDLALQQRQALIPVVYVELTEAEEAEVLATLDPLAAMALADATALDALLREVTTGDAAIQAMLAALAEDAGITPPDFEPVGIEEQGRLDQRSPIVCPECGHEWTPGR